MEVEARRAPYLWFVQLQTFNGRLGVNYGRWLKSLHGTMAPCINGTLIALPETQLMIWAQSLVHACVATVAALAGEMSGIYDMWSFSDEELATCDVVVDSDNLPVCHASCKSAVCCLLRLASRWSIIWLVLISWGIYMVVMWQEQSNML